MDLLRFATAGSVESALRRTALLAVAIAFAAMTGVLLGAIAVASDTIRPRGGRPVLLAIVLLPWIVGGLVDLPHASVPGALEAFLETFCNLMPAPPPRLTSAGNLPATDAHF